MLDFFLNNRWLVLVLLLALLVGGVYTMLHLNIEAYPDLTNVQVVVTAEAPGMSPVEVEQLVTFPIETSMLGMPKLEVVRSVSKLGLTMVTIVFDDSMDLYLARQLVSERLGEVRGRMPAGVQPVMNPMITAFGEVYQFTMQGPHWGLMQLKTLLDWDVRYDLRKVPGVSAVNSWGGYTKQYTVEVDPLSLRSYGLSVHDIVQRVADNNANFGGGFIEHNEEQYNIRGLGRAASVEDLGRIVVLSHNGVPVLLRDVARISTLPYPRQGAIMRDGKGESVCGMVITLKGTNSRQIIQDVKQHIEHMKLPAGVHITPFYDQSRVIDDSIHTIERNLFEAGVLVVCILLIFLGNWRAALIVASVIPLSLLFGFLGMALFGVSANLMSLGALDFGMIVDGSVVMVENFIHRMENESEEDSNKPILERIRPAVREMAKPVTFGVAIIIAVYLPIFTLQGLEGRMFRPMAITVCSALIGSLLLALFAIPTVSSFVLSTNQIRRRNAKKKENWFARLRVRYFRSLEWALRHRGPILTAAGLCVVGAIFSLRFIGTEFMPKLDEVELVVTSRKLPGISLSESIYLGRRIEKVIRSFPEVKGVVTKMGRPDFATEAMGVEESDSYLMLEPQTTWKCCSSKDELIEKLSKRLDDEVPGAAFVFTQPMEMRMDEVVTGIRGDLALKIFGPDLYTLDRLAAQAVALISSVPGAAEVHKDSSMGIADLNVNINRAGLERYGLNVSDVQELVETMLGGKQVSEMLEGEQRFPIAVRLPNDYRNDIEKLGDLYLIAPSGERVQLRQVADIRTVQGPEMVNREDARRRVAVQASVRGRDLGGFVKAAQQKIAHGMKIPPGYRLDWGGQFENQKRANQRLAIVLPVSIVIIFALLFATFRNVKQALLILLIVPFALVGGIAALWLRGLNLSLSASIGFIALFGVAVLNGVVMVSYIDTLLASGCEMMDGIKRGAMDRLRPVLMTALVASLGFIPMAISTSRGAEVQRPLATVVIGGLITATILTLYLLPMLYPWFTPERLRSERKNGS
ncbi:MAG TPA: CusA/CzcA family heavy metal efflux RND transporter [Bryobacteraceae bacterium]|nr:CusA/CzcA family heavy metal efflux RND transporter [Bryobacteraceae bacterium]